MNYNDFRWMQRGKQLRCLHMNDRHLLEPVDKRGTGKTKALLLLHGFSSSPAVFRTFLPKLLYYDALVCPALQGHAADISTFSLSQAKDWRATAVSTCASLIDEYENVDVLGLSLGGLLACELSHMFSLKHLFLLAPALKLKMNLRFLLSLTKTLQRLGFSRLRNRAGNLLTDTECEMAYRTLPLTAIREMLTLAQHIQWTPPPCTTDLFLGVQDAVVDSQEVAQLFCTSPAATIHWLANSAHVLPLDNDYLAIVDCINQRSHP